MRYLWCIYIYIHIYIYIWCVYIYMYMISVGYNWWMTVAWWFLRVSLSSGDDHPNFGVGWICMGVAVVTPPQSGAIPETPNIMIPNFLCQNSDLGESLINSVDGYSSGHQNIIILPQWCAPNGYASELELYWSICTICTQHSSQDGLLHMYMKLWPLTSQKSVEQI